MREHAWKPGVEGSEVCSRAGCTIIRYAKGGMWQRKKGGHWRRVDAEAIPECKGVALSSEEAMAIASLPLWTNGRFNVDRTGTARTLHGDVIQDQDLQDLAAALLDALRPK